MARIPYRGTRALPDVSGTSEDVRREAVRTYATRANVAAKVDPRFQGIAVLQQNSRKKKR